MLNLFSKMHFRNKKTFTFFVTFTLLNSIVELGVLLLNEMNDPKKKANVKTRKITLEREKTL